MRFLVTSAINNDPRRLQETLGTLESIWNRYPLSSIVLTESSLHKPDTGLLEAIPKRVHLVPFWGCEFIHDAHNTGMPLGFVQNAIEIDVMIRVLDWLTEDENYKISGRYQLTDRFNPVDTDKFLFKRRIATGFSQDECGTTHMFMTRLYKIPRSRVDELDEALKMIKAYHWFQWKIGKPFDIEHGMFKFLRETSVQEVDSIGVRGRIGHSEHIVED